MAIQFPGLGKGFAALGECLNSFMPELTQSLSCLVVGDKNAAMYTRFKFMKSFHKLQPFNLQVQIKTSSEWDSALGF